MPRQLQKTSELKTTATRNRKPAASKPAGKTPRMLSTLDRAVTKAPPKSSTAKQRGARTRNSGESTGARRTPAKPPQKRRTVDDNDNDDDEGFGYASDDSLSVARDRYMLMFNGDLRREQMERRNKRKTSTKTPEKGEEELEVEEEQARKAAEIAERNAALVSEEARTIRYDPGKHPRLRNPLNGDSGRGLCHRSGIFRIGRSFEKRAVELSERFLLEFVLKTVALQQVKNRTVITVPIVLKVARSMGMFPVVTE